MKTAFVAVTAAAIRYRQYAENQVVDHVGAVAAWGAELAGDLGMAEDRLWERVSDRAGGSVCRYRRRHHRANKIKKATSKGFYCFSTARISAPYSLMAISCEHSSV